MHAPSSTFTSPVAYTTGAQDSWPAADYDPVEERRALMDAMTLVDDGEWHVAHKSRFVELRRCHEDSGLFVEASRRERRAFVTYWSGTGADYVRQCVPLELSHVGGYVESLRRTGRISC
jgi:hypothetical protein